MLVHTRERRDLWGAEMAFITIDTEAISIAIDELKSVSGEVDDHYGQQRQRADRTREALYALHNANLVELAVWELEQLWSSLSFDALSSEFKWASDQQVELLRQVNNALTTLAERHAGQLNPRILDLIDPLGSDFQRVMNPLIEVTGWLNFSNLWTLRDNPHFVLGLLESTGSEFDTLMRDLGLTDETLDRLRQHTLLLIEDLEKPLASYLNSPQGQAAAELLNNVITLGDDAAGLLKDGSAAAKIIGNLDKFGAISLVGSLLDFATDKDHSMHSLTSHLLGGGIETLVSLTGVGAAINTAVPLIGMGASLEADALHAAGNAQGGRWKSVDYQVGDQWSQTSKDADALSSVYKDVGSLVLDSGALTFVGGPALAPAMIAAQYELGANPRNLGGDANSLIQDGGTLLRLPFDLARSVVSTRIIETGDDARILAQALPPGVRQSVDNAVYDVTSFAIKGLGL